MSRDDERPDIEQKRSKVRVRDKRVKADDDAADSAELTQDAPDSELEEARALAEERLDQLRRLKADFENFRQRLIREQTDVVERASRRIVEQLVPVLDDFDRALSAATDSADEGFVRGVELVFRKLQEVLTTEGLERFPATEGPVPFDPQEHDAVASEHGEVSEPVVLDVVRPGYRLKGSMLRPALVRVCMPEEGGG